MRQWPAPSASLPTIDVRSRKLSYIVAGEKLTAIYKVRPSAEWNISLEFEQATQTSKIQPELQTEPETHP